MDENFRKFSNQSHYQIAELKSEKMRLDEALSFCQYSKLTLSSQLKLAEGKLNDTQAELDDRQLDLHKCNRDYDISKFLMFKPFFHERISSDKWFERQSS